MSDITDWTTTTPIDPTDLPHVVRAYLAAHLSDLHEAAIACLAPGAVVTDEGKDHIGHERIREWMDRASGDYTYTIELIGAGRIDEHHVDAVHHLEGDFPGNVVDLHFRFTVAGDQITRLVIEP